MAFSYADSGKEIQTGEIKMKEAVIVSAVRTPQGKFGGSLKDLSAVELGSIAVEGLFEKIDRRPECSNDVLECKPEELEDLENCQVEEEYYNWNDELETLAVDEVILGNVLQGGQGQNPARQVSIKTGIPREVPAYTVNMVCGSGMKAVTSAAGKIESGKADVVIAGGFESMSNAPYILPDARWGRTMDITGKGETVDMMVWDGLYEIFYDCHMGKTAENLAELYDISREEQERLSIESQNRALKAIEEGIFDDEIVPVEVRDGVVDQDEQPRETDLGAVKDLPPVFDKDGTITAATSSGISDGAAALLITSKEFADKNDLEILAKVSDYTSVGVDPKYMGLGAAAAMEDLLNKTGLEKKDVDLFEENEAFAAQMLACMEATDTPKYGVGINEDGGEKINPYGSGISLGHPIGATGARILVTLAHALKRREDHRGLANLCVGGGIGIATLLERDK